MRKRKANQKGGGSGGEYRKRKLTLNEQSRGPSDEKPLRSSSFKDVIGDPTVNPLLIDIILDKIFRYVFSPHDGNHEDAICQNACNFRLVCKQWRDRATSAFCPPCVRLRFGMWREATEEKIKSHFVERTRFLETMRNSSSIPVKRFILSGSMFTIENRKILSEFVELTPATIQLSILFNESSEISLNISETFSCLNLAKLETLWISCYREQLHNTGSDSIPILIGLILSSAKNLIKFEFDYHIWPHSNMTDESTAAFSEICLQIPKTIKTLKLNMPSMSDIQFDILSGKGLQLEELDFECDSFGKEAIQQFLRNQSPYLKKMHFKRRVPLPFDAVDVPQLSAIKYLCLTGNSALPLCNYNTFPNLSILNVDGLDKGDAWKKLVSGGQENSTVKELFLPFAGRDTEIFKMAAEKFPSVTKLHVHEWSLKEVFLHWTHIEELHVKVVHGGSDHDSLLTGISPQKRNFIRKKGSFDKVDLTNNKLQPSFVSLTKLKKLWLTGGSEQFLTDFSVHFAFLKMANLETLYVNMSRLNENLSAGYASRLKEKVKIVELRE